MTGMTRSSHGLDIRRRRLLFRAWHRGTREMDLLLGRFADARVASLDEAELGQLEALMDVPDRDLFVWLTAPETTPANYDLPVLRELRAFHLEAPRIP